MNSPKVFIGIDVGVRRGLSLCAVSPHGQIVWSEACRLETLPEVLDRVERRTATRDWAFGIDAPRFLLSEPRAWAWRSGAWTQGPRTLRGRHSEVILKAFGLTIPAWTPLEEEAPVWMQTGLELYRMAALASSPEQVHEVSPAASKRQIARQQEIRAPYGRMFRRSRNLTPRARAELEAFTAAWTVALYESGQGCAAGGGDGLGSIILPGRLADGPKAALSYPNSAAGSRMPALQPSTMR